MAARMPISVILGGALLTMSGLVEQAQGQTVAVSPQAQPRIIDLPELVARSQRGVVTILVYDASDKLASQGSGFFIEPRRLVPNRHVVEGAHRVEIRLSSGRRVGR
jgi:S1-C subfamily serine protease